MIFYFERSEKKGSAERSEAGSYFEQSEKKGSGERSEAGSYTRYKILDTRYKLHGIAALITVLSLGGLIFTISMGSALISFWANQNIKSIRDSNKAFYAAQSGLQDALIKLERNKDFNSSFNLSINGTDDVSVFFYNDLDGHATATSTATLSQVNKELQAVIDIDTTTGLITPTSTVEETL